MVLAGAAPVALACAVCTGGPESAQAEGMNYAILFLLGVSASVVTGLGVVASRVVGAEHCLEPDAATGPEAGE
jgi:hypothetical protein